MRKITTTIEESVYKEIKESGYSVADVIREGWFILKNRNTIEQELMFIKRKLEEHEKKMYAIEWTIKNIVKKRD